MAIKRKNYSALISKGIPKVIHYEIAKILSIEIEYHRPAEAVSFDRRDIYNSSKRIEKIDHEKNYISII